MQCSIRSCWSCRGSVMMHTAECCYFAGGGCAAVAEDCMQDGH